MSYRLETTRRFEKDFKKLASDLKHRIDQAVKTLGSSALLREETSGRVRRES